MTWDEVLLILLSWVAIAVYVKIQARREKSSAQSTVTTTENSDAEHVAIGICVATPIIPAGKTVNVGSADNDLGDYGEGPPVPVRTALHIDYEDAAGERSSRRIATRNLRVAHGDIVINAWCYERQARRSFLASRIEGMAYIDTGEVIPDPKAWAQETYSADPRGAAWLKQQQIDFERYARWDALWSAFTVLAYVARADGKMVAAERAVIVGTMRQLIADDGEAQKAWPDIDGRARRFFAAHDEFLRAVRDMKMRPAGERQILLAGVENVIKADGRDDPGELRALKWITGRIGTT